MRATLRHSMDYLHTWAGLIFSVLLFLVFFMGTLSVFDNEIDRWMLPETRVAQPAKVSFERVALPHLERLAPDAKFWSVQYPHPREPVMRVSWIEDEKFITRYVDVNSGDLLREAGSKGGTGFFFPFHYSFHIKWMDIGYWLLAIVSVAMMVLLISGVIIHKKIFADFFTFRPGRSIQRATLDVHNASSVLLLPFHFVITLSGLIIFVFIYMKPGMTLLYGNDAGKVVQEASGGITRGPASIPGKLASVDAMVAQAQELWKGGSIRRIAIRNPKDGNATVDVQRRPLDQVAYDTHAITFDGVTGEVIHRQTGSTAMSVQRFISGLHMTGFDHWWLRWLYFVMGLISCVMIGTGLLLWVEKRRVRHHKEGRSGYWVVNAVAVAGSIGLVTATLAMLVANKLLPADLNGRASLEQWIFFGMWLGSLLHAFARGRDTHPHADIRIAWREQAYGIACLAALAVLLNAVVTGDHLLSTLSQRQWAIAGMDLVLLITVLLAAFAIRRLAQRPETMDKEAAARGIAA